MKKLNIPSVILILRLTNQNVKNFSMWIFELIITTNFENAGSVTPSVQNHPFGIQNH